MDRLTIVKVGGKIVEEEDSLLQLLEEFSKIEGYKLLVHGGGRSATQLCERLNIPTQMVDGRRITCLQTLEVATMVYGGLVNKNIVAKLQSLGVDSIGLTGADMDIIRAEKRPIKNGIDYGYVGDVVFVDDRKISELVRKNMILVLAPLTHDGKGSLLNTNADSIAATTAKKLSKLFKVRLIYCFEKKGVLKDENDEDSVIRKINKITFKQLKENKIITGGMIPKLENAFESVEAGVQSVIIARADLLNSEERTEIMLEFSHSRLPIE